MKKEKITFEDLALVSFLKFDRLDGIDITVLKEMISNKFELVIDDMIDNYFITNEGIIIVNTSYVDNFIRNISNDMVEKVKKTEVYKKIDEINFIEFILRKIKIMGEGNVLVDDLDNIFEPLELGIINRLFKDGYVREYCHNDIIYGDYSAIKLTKRGELFLYVIDNKKQIDNFSNMLKELDCDEQLVSSFLIAQDLNRNINEILTINNFMNFCQEYGYSIFRNDNELIRKKNIQQIIE